MLDDRVLIIGVEVNGELRSYSGGANTVKINRSADEKQNSCVVTMTGLLAEVRNFLLTECSPWAPNRKPKIITITAGRQSTGIQRIFTGEISETSVSDKPDVTLTLKALTSNGIKYNFLAWQSPKTIQLSDLSKKVAADYGLKLRFEATDKTVSNYVYNGSAARQVSHLALMGDVDAFVDNDYLVVKNLGEANKGSARLLSKNTQLLGTPLLDDKGAKARMLFDPTVNVGDAVQIESEMNPAANGQYTIYNLAISLASRAQDWYCDLSMNNENIRSILKNREADAKKKAKAESEAKKLADKKAGTTNG